MKIRIDNTDVDEEKNEVKVTFRMLNNSGRLIKKNQVIKVPLDGYTKNSVLAAVKMAAISNIAKPDASLPKAENKKVVKSELEGVEIHIDENNLTDAELLMASRVDSLQHDVRQDIDQPDDSFEMDK